MKQILVIFLLLLSSSVAFGQKSSQKHPVEAFFMAGIEAFNQHNLDKFMEQFATDVEMYTPTGWLRGDATVKERFVGTFKQFPNVKMEIEDLKVREVSSKTAIVDFRWKTYPMGQGPAFYGVGSGVYVKRKGKWLEVLEHETVTHVDDALRTTGGND